MNTEFEIYKGKSFQSLCRDIIENSSGKKVQLDILVSELREKIKTPNDAIVVVPLIKDYLEIGIKNDEQLVKLASVVQRIMTNSSDENIGIGAMTNEELEDLKKEALKIKQEMEEKQNSENKSN